MLSPEKRGREKDKCERGKAETLNIYKTTTREQRAENIGRENKKEKRISIQRQNRKKKYIKIRKEREGKREEKIEKRRKRC